MSTTTTLKTLVNNIAKELEYDVLHNNTPTRISRAANTSHINKTMRKYGFVLLCDEGAFRVVYTHPEYPGVVFKCARDSSRHNISEYQQWCWANNKERALLCEHLYLSNNGFIAIMERMEKMSWDNNFPFSESEVDEFINNTLHDTWRNYPKFAADLHFGNIGVARDGTIRITDYEVL